MTRYEMTEKELWEYHTYAKADGRVSSASWAERFKIPESRRLNYQGHPDQRFGHVTYSQNGEDLALLNIFEKLVPFDKLRYLDIGAHHPETISNTKLLYDRGASGVNVDANPILGKDFETLRPRDIWLPVGVVPDNPGPRMLNRVDPRSGRNTLSDTEVVMLSEQHGLKIKDRIAVPCRTINDIVREQFNGAWPQLLLLDIEGLDDDVLASAEFDTDSNRPQVIVIESRNFSKTNQILWDMGYRRLLSMGENIIAVNIHLGHI